MQATGIPVRDFSDQIIGIRKTYPKFRQHLLVVPQIKRHQRRKHYFLPAYPRSSGKSASSFSPQFQLQFLPQAPVWSEVCLTSLHDRPRSRRGHEPFPLHVGFGHGALLQQEKSELELWAWVFRLPSTLSFESDAPVAQVIWVLPSSCPGLRTGLGFISLVG